jgi:hypothetical protein
LPGRQQLPEQSCLEPMLSAGKNTRLHKRNLLLAARSAMPVSKLTFRRSGGGRSRRRK